MNALLTPGEVAAMLKVAPTTVTDRRWLARVGLAPVKLGHSLRFRPADVERLINGRSGKPRLRARQAGEEQAVTPQT